MTVAQPLAGCLSTEPSAGPFEAVFLGLCDDRQSSYRTGSSSGPEAVRSYYDGACYHSTSEKGIQLKGRILDLGNLEPEESWKKDCTRYIENIAVQVRAKRALFVAGGDHAVTVPVIKSLEEIGRPIHVIQLDAHPDLYPSYDKNPDSHACVGSRILEMEHVAALHQIGVRTWNRAQRDNASRFGARVISPDGSVERLSPLELDDVLIYLTVDLDVFEPAFAPGVAHPVPGGLTPRQVLNWIQALPGKLIGMDVVELNPGLDVNGLTAVLAGRLLHEGMAKALATAS